MSQWLCHTRRREASEAGERNEGWAFLLSCCTEDFVYFVMASMNICFCLCDPGEAPLAPVQFFFRFRSLSAHSNTV